MRLFYKITIVALTLLLAGACDSWSGFKADDEMIARVGTSYLYRSQLASSMPSGIAAADSVGYSKAFVDKWIVSQLKFEEAEQLFSQSEEDIDRMVEAYRHSLLVRKLDQHVLKNATMSDVAESDIADYYKKHKGDFRIVVPMVKGKILVFADSYRRREQLLKLFTSSNSEHREDFEQLCLKNNFQYHHFEEWVAVSDFLSYLPLTRDAKQEKIVADRKLQQIHHNKMYYYFQITATLNRGDTMPLSMAKENIRQILINRRRSNIVREHEELLLKNAISSGHAVRIEK